MNEDKFIVRLFDMFDGWIDISDAITKSEADAIWMKKTSGGTKNVRYSDGDYYKIFPADTKMRVTPECLGR
jgi:hypothetical protein